LQFVFWKIDNNAVNLQPERTLLSPDDATFAMVETKYNGPEMNARKLTVLLLAAALLLILFLSRTRCGNHQPEAPVEEAPFQEQFLYISPYDSLFRLYADSVCDWKMLAAIAYVESKFDTAAHSYRGAQGLMQIMPSTYRHTLAKMGVPDTMAQNVELDVIVAVNYIGQLNSLFTFINEKERINYILGSYNGGSNHIFDAMRVARKQGVNRYSWSSLTPVLVSLSDPDVYTDSICRYGYFDATETLNYVRRVTRKYNEYKSQDLLFRAFEKLADNNKNK
jgi:soluble lytic murein transglycosylase-like protein